MAVGQSPKFIQGYITHNIKKERSHESEKPSRMDKVKEGGSSRDRRHK